MYIDRHYISRYKDVWLSRIFREEERGQTIDQQRNNVSSDAYTPLRGQMKNHSGGRKRVFPLSRAISNSRKSARRSSRPSSFFFSFFLSSFPCATFIIFLSPRGEKRQNVRPVDRPAGRAVGRHSWQRLRQLGENWIDSVATVLPSFPVRVAATGRAE